MVAEEGPNPGPSLSHNVRESLQADQHLELRSRQALGRNPARLRPSGPVPVGYATSLQPVALAPVGWTATVRAVGRLCDRWGSRGDSMARMQKPTHSGHVSYWRSVGPSRAKTANRGGYVELCLDMCVHRGLASRVDVSALCRAGHDADRVGAAW